MSTPLRPEPEQPAAPGTTSRLVVLLRNADYRNSLLIMGGWLCAIIIVPFGHEFTTVDDWTYVNAVRDYLDTGLLHTPSMSQTNLVGLTVWGALWAWIFGFNITTLTASTLTMALAALLIFYATMRSLDISPPAALFGTALLGFNTIFFHLSYSFMTDVPFLALLLAAVYCYLRAARGDGWGEGTLWALAGSAFVSWSYFIRQFALLAPLAFGLYLIVDGLLSRKWKSTWWWARLVAAVGVPAGIVLLHVLTTPPSRAAELGLRRAELFLFKEPWLRVFFLRAFSALSLVALFSWGALKVRLRHLWLVLVVGALFIFGMDAVDLPNERWIQQIEPPFTARAGPFTYDFPNEPYTFGAYGNTVRVTGVDFDEFFYTQQPIWDAKVWRYLHLFGVLLAAFLSTAIFIAFYGWLRAFRPQQGLTPLAGFYFLGAVVFAASLALPGDYFDRYSLAFTPFFIVFVVRGAPQWDKWAWRYSLTGLILLATFTLLAKADHMEHNRVRWEAAAWVEERTGEVKAGWNWNHWGHADSESYRVDDLPTEGFRVERRFPYTCRLCGFTTRYVLAQARSDMPPLPPGPR
jgi:hypothetical protein